MKKVLLSSVAALAVFAAAAPAFADNGIVVEKNTQPNGTIAKLLCDRSEERRVGKECRVRWWPNNCKKKKTGTIKEEGVVKVE